MPNRYLRESFKESESVSELSWEAESTYIRLIVTVDDFGRIEANPKILRPKLFPLRLDRVRETQLERWLAECEKVRLLRFYQSGGKEFIQMMKWEKGRAKKSKYPDPPPEIANQCFHMLTDENISPDSDTDSDSDTDNPQTPKGGGRQASKSGWQPDPLQRRLNAIFRRRDTTAWTEKEKRALKALLPIPDADTELIETYYRFPIPQKEDYRRRDLCTLLNNWPGELDRARAFLDKRGAMPRVKMEEPGDWREWLERTYPPAEFPDRELWERGPWSAVPPFIKDEYRKANK